MYSIDLNEDESLISTGSDDKKVKIFKINTKKEVANKDFEIGVRQVKWISKN